MITSATVKITERCNLDCEMCGKYVCCLGKSPCPRDMSTEFAKDALKGLWISSCRRLNIVGGEPLMHPSISDILDYAQILGYLVVLSTNGTLISKNIAEKLRENLNDPSFVRVGIGKENFERAKEGIINLRRSEVITGLDVTISSPEEIDRAFDTAKKLGVNHLRCLPMRGSDITLYKKSTERLKKIALRSEVMKDFLPLTTEIKFRCPAETYMYISPEGIRKRCPYEDAQLEDPSKCCFLENVLPQEVLDFDLTDKDTRKAVSSWLYSLAIDKGMPRCFLDYPVWNLWLEV